MDKAIIFLSNVPHLVFIIKTRTLLIFFQVISVGVFVEKAEFLFTLKLEKDFLLNQQNGKKKKNDATFSYSGSFRGYLTELLQGIDTETDDRFDALTNKKAKYLFLIYNDFLL